VFRLFFGSNSEKDANHSTDLSCTEVSRVTENE